MVMESGVCRGWAGQLRCRQDADLDGRASDRYTFCSPFSHVGHLSAANPLSTSSSLSPQAPIGVFDSGMGGLSVLKQLRRALPTEDFWYVADTAHVPYGPKSDAFVCERSLAIGGHLAAAGCKALVVACNTATAAAARALREHLPMPVIGMEPAVKPATSQTRSGVIGVLATEATLSSGRFAALLERFGTGVKVVTQPCPGLVERVEAGDLDGLETLTLLRRYLAPLQAAGADTVVLGCTHYPFLRPILAALLGPGVTLIETGPAVARQTQVRLEEAGLLHPAAAAGGERFLATAPTAAASAVASRLWGAPVTFEPLLV